MPKPENTTANAGTGAEESAEDLLTEAFGEILGDEESEDEQDDETLDDEEAGPDEETLESPDGEASEEGDDEEEDADAKPTAKRIAVKDDDPVFTDVDDDGNEKLVTAAEAKAGWMRTKDYTQKRMKEAEIAKAAEAEKEMYGKLVGQYQEYLDKLLSGAPSPEELATLKAENPEAYLLKMEELRELRAEREAAASEKARLYKERHEKDVAAFKEHLAAESVKLYEKLPHWKDDKVAEREKKAIRALLKSEGFTDEQIADGMTDHRLVLLIRDAGLYRQGKSRIAKGPRPKAGTSLRPGTGTPSKSGGQKGQFARASARLRQTGGVEDAARVFETMPGLL